MGLDTSHDCWHGPYSAFSRFRDALAEAAGFRHCTGPLGIPCVELDWGGICRMIGSDLAGEWKVMPVRHDGKPEPLIVLLAHSDCDGKIQANMCGPLADRIEELIPMLDAAGDNFRTNDARRFVAGLRRAAQAGEPVEFR